MNSLKNKVIILTGASRGIGKATAKLASKHEAKMVLISRNKTALVEMRNDLISSDDDILLIEADVSDLKDCDRLVKEAIDKFGRVDILINNAAQFGRYSLEELDMKDFDRIMNTNIRSVVYLTKVVSGIMKQQNEGTIVNISSTAGKRGYQGGIAYATSKFALNGFTECIAKELREFNIRIVTISPSSVDTRGKDEADIKTIGKGVYMRMEDVAETIILSISLPQRAMLKDIEIWGTNP